MTAEVTAAADVHELGQQIVDLIGAPKDAWEIAAQLEVLGLRDRDVRAAYGTRDLFELAGVLFTQFERGAFRIAEEREDIEAPIHPIVRFAKNYFEGLAFSLPMTLQAAAMLIWGYGLWGATDVDLRAGSAIALGFIASYIVCGGSSQALVRRGLFYVYQEEPSLARWTALRAWSLSLQLAFALLVPALLLNAVLTLLPWRMLLTAAAYYAGLSVLWMNWSLIYLVRKTPLFLGVTIVALAIEIVAVRVTHCGPLTANATGLGIADVLSFAVGIRALNQLARTRPGIPVNPPRLIVLVYTTSKFLLYGLLYNSFMFADRVIAWTSNVGREDFPPYPFWLNVRYEIGMDLALIVIVILAGVVEHSIRRFSETLVPAEKRTGDAAAFIGNARAVHRRRMVTLGICSIVAVAIAVATTLVLRGMPSLRIHASLMSTTATVVFAGGAVAYVLFMFALQNILILLTLSRVELAVRAVAIALGVNVAVGFVCSRAIHYSAAVAGLMAGTIVLLTLTARATRRVLEELDYYYYAAF